MVQVYTRRAIVDADTDIQALIQGRWFVHPTLLSARYKNKDIKVHDLAQSCIYWTYLLRIYIRQYTVCLQNAAVYWRNFSRIPIWDDLRTIPRLLGAFLTWLC